MKPHKDIHCHHNRQKLQTSEVHFPRTQRAHQPLRRLRQPEYRSQIHCQCRCKCRGCEDLEIAVRVAPGFCKEDREDDDEEEEAEDLEGEAGEEDVVWGGGGFSVRVGDADESGTGDLDDGGEDVEGDEDGEDEFWTEGGELEAYAVDGDGD